jgi:two-component system response regulator AtoC
VGKELVARRIHSESIRAKGPFVPLDCASVPADLVESELFGHLRGAFTGATDSYPGMFAAAHRGTLFLDEIGELPLRSQAKLLRVLQERVIRRVGSVQYVPVDVRILAATNRDLRRLTKAGSFRQDLFYRLNVVRIEVPPLRERREDIPILARHFLRRYTPLNRQLSLSPEAIEALQAYSWPGNVRELENTIYRGCILATGSVILPKDLATDLKAAYMIPRATAGQYLRPLQEIEREAIVEALVAERGNRIRAAARLRIGKSTIYRKVKEYGLSA